MCQLQLEKLDGAHSQPVPVYRHAGESSTCLPLLPHRRRPAPTAQKTTSGCGHDSANAALVSFAAPVILVEGCCFSGARLPATAMLPSRILTLSLSTPRTLRVLTTVVRLYGWRCLLLRVSVLLSYGECSYVRIEAHEAAGVPGEHPRRRDTAHGKKGAGHTCHRTFLLFLDFSPTLLHSSTDTFSVLVL